jgi:hypothetical protein
MQRAPSHKLIARARLSPPLAKSFSFLVLVLVRQERGAARRQSSEGPNEKMSENENDFVSDGRFAVRPLPEHFRDRDFPAQL